MTPEWTSIEVFRDEASAQSIAGRLRMEGVPAVVQHAGPIPGLEEVHVLVPDALVTRARSVLAAGEFTEAELIFLATGEPGGKDGS